MKDDGACMTFDNPRAASHQPSMCPKPVKPAPRPERVSLFSYLLRFRKDILSAQPARLYRAWMAEFRTPFFRFFLCNDPALIDRVLSEHPEDFPKSTRLFEGLVPLLGHSIFITNGAEWRRQRRIIDPAFESGRLREVFPAMWDAAVARGDRLAEMADGRVIDVEPQIGAFDSLVSGYADRLSGKISGQDLVSKLKAFDPAMDLSDGFLTGAFGAQWSAEAS